MEFEVEFQIVAYGSVRVTAVDVDHAEDIVRALPKVELIDFIDDKPVIIYKGIQVEDEKVYRPI